MNDSVNWTDWMTAAVHGAGISLDAFWGLTPAELMFLLGKTQNIQPLNRDRLAQLCAQFPDKE